MRQFLRVALFSGSVLVLAACQPAASSVRGDASAPADSQLAAVRDRGAGGVTVEATRVSTQAIGQVAFKLALDTHSADLSKFNVQANTVLRDGAGREVGASGWVDESGDSHHRSGVITFPAGAAAGSGRVNLIVRNLAGVSERVLTFTMEGRES